MGLSFKTGSFTILTSDTGAKAITGVDLGVAAKAVLLVANRLTAAGYADGAQMSIGAATSSSQEWCVGAIAEDAQATMDTACILRNDACLALFASNSVASIDCQCDFTSFDGADGDFTINVSNAPSATVTVTYYIWGGTDISSVKAGTFTMASGAGPTTVTDPGFTQEAVLFASHGRTTTNSIQAHSRQMFGAATSVIDQACGSTASSDASVDSECSQTQRLDRCILFQTNSSDEGQAHLASFDANGFTLTHDVNMAAAFPVGYLAFAGGQWWAGGDVQRTDVGTQARTGVGFQPIGMVMAGLGNTATTSRITAAPAWRRSIGGSDGTNARAMWNGEEDAAATSVNASRYSSTKIITHSTPAATGASSTTAAEAGIPGGGLFQSDGYTLDWTTADATAREFWSLLFAADSGTTPASTEVIAGQLVITTPGGQTGYGGIDTDATYDLEDSHFGAELVDAGAQSANREAFISAYLDASNHVELRVFNSNLEARQTVAGTPTTLDTAVYSATNHRHLRLREAAGTTFWEFRSDAGDWTELHSVANPVSVSSVTLRIRAGNINSTTATTVIFDNVNVGAPPVAGVEEEELMGVW